MKVLCWSLDKVMQSWYLDQQMHPDTQPLIISEHQLLDELESFRCSVRCLLLCLVYKQDGISRTRATLLCEGKFHCANLGMGRTREINVALHCWIAIYLLPPRRLCYREHLSVCLFVGKTTRKVQHGFGWNFLTMWVAELWVDGGDPEHRLSILDSSRL